MEYPIVVIETKNRTLEETAALFDGEDATNLIVGQAVGQIHEPNVTDEKMDEKLSESLHEPTSEEAKA